MYGKVMVVDDDGLLRKQLSVILSGAGYSCQCAENGLHALRLALREAYALIVTDLEMPGLDGLKFVRRVRAAGANRDTPIIVVSAANGLATVQRAITLGIQGYLLKPVFADDLLKKAAELTARPRE